MHTLCLLDIKVNSTVWHDVASYHCCCSSSTLNVRKLNRFYLSLLSPWQVNEPDYNSMSSGKLKYLPPRFMTINTAVEQLLEAEEGKKEVNTVIHFCSDIIHQDSCVIFGFILMHLSTTIHPSHVPLPLLSYQGYCTRQTLGVGMARLGQPTQKVCVWYRAKADFTEMVLFWCGWGDDTKLRFMLPWHYTIHVTSIAI